MKLWDIYVKKFKDKGGDKNKNSRLRFLPLSDEKLLKSIKPIGPRLKI